MDKFIQPSEVAVKGLLRLSNLDSSDLTPAHLKHFFGLGSEGEPEGIFGLELFTSVGLLRSLDVVPSRRKAGLSSRLVAYAEGYARSHGIKALYVLTNTAEAFFMHRSYQGCSRNAAPRAIRETKEFSEICPASSVFMVKNL